VKKREGAAPDVVGSVELWGASLPWTEDVGRDFCMREEEKKEWRERGETVEIDEAGAWASSPRPNTWRWPRL